MSALQESNASRRVSFESRNALEQLERHLGGGLSDEQKARMIRRRELAKTAERCYKCDRELEVVWRVRVYVGRNVFGGSASVILPHCEECAPRRYGFAEPCVTCGRAVDTENNWHRRVTACGRACRAAVHAARARARREQGRPTQAACVQCGETFTPPRIDARYCSNACRQRAYRARREAA